MKKIFVFFLLLLVFVLLTACGTQTETVQHSCAVCGGPYDLTISGPAYQMESYGISMSECSEVTSGIYTAYICDNCLGPVYDPFK